jgi:hypothetical protein
VLGPAILTVTSALLEICAKRLGEPEVRTRTEERQRTASAETIKTVPESRVT